jgi:Pyridoxamine 5'-phosphate oxidase
MTITPAIRELIESGPLAHVTTLNGNEFLTAHMGEWQKVKNLRKDPRVALSLLGRGKNAMGLQEYLVVYGQARVTEGGAPELLQRLARIYLGPNVDFPPESLRSKPGFIVHITSERYAGIGPWQPRQH